MNAFHLQTRIIMKEKEYTKQQPETKLLFLKIAVFVEQTLPVSIGLA